MSDLTRGLTEIDKALPEYRIAHLFASGQAKEVFASKAIAAAIRASADKYRVNLAKRPITAILDRCKVASVTVSTPDELASNETLTEVFHQKVWRPNEQEIELPQALSEALEYGDAYLVVWPSAGQELDPDRPIASQVDVFVHNPLGMRAVYSAENPRKIRFVIHTWADENDHQRVNLYYADRLERFISIKPIPERTPEESGYRDEMFREYDDDEQDAVIANPWREMPVYHLRTARPYGRPEHADAYGPQNILTKLIATQMSVVDHYGWPFRYALSKSGTTGADLADWDEDDRTAPGNQGKRDTIDGKPGGFAKLHDTDSVGQLDAAPASNFTEPIRQHVALMALATGTPMDLGTNNQRVSGESQREGKEPLINRAVARQTSFGATLSAAYGFAMRLLGFPEAIVKVNWHSAHAVNDAEGWETVGKKQEFGVPVRQTLIEAGYGPEEIDEWERTVSGGTLEDRVILLAKLAEASASLGRADTDSAGPVQDAINAIVTELASGVQAAPRGAGDKEFSPSDDVGVDEVTAR